MFHKPAHKDVDNPAGQIVNSDPIHGEIRDHNTHAPNGVIDAVVARSLALDRAARYRHEAGCEAIGVLDALLAGGDIPEYAKEQARRLLDKFHGRLAIPANEYRDAQGFTSTERANVDMREGFDA